MLEETMVSNAHEHCTELEFLDLILLIYHVGQGYGAIDVHQMRALLAMKVNFAGAAYRESLKNKRNRAKRQAMQSASKQRALTDCEDLSFELWEQC
jgi:hypothetical protein